MLSRLISPFKNILNGGTKNRKQSVSYLGLNRWICWRCFKYNECWELRCSTCGILQTGTSQKRKKRPEPNREGLAEPRKSPKRVRFAKNAIDLANVRPVSPIVPADNHSHDQKSSSSSSPQPRDSVAFPDALTGVYDALKKAQDVQRAELDAERKKSLSQENQIRLLERQNKQHVARSQRVQNENASRREVFQERFSETAGETEKLRGIILSQEKDLEKKECLVESVTQNNLVLKAEVVQNLGKINQLEGRLEKAERAYELAKKNYQSTADRLAVKEEQCFENEKLCVACLDVQVGMCFLPCGHVTCCEACGDGLSKCPCCRVVIERKVKITL